jgi:hypothetical protein
VKSSLSLGPGEVRDVDVDQNGIVYVLFAIPTDRLVIYQPDGKVADDRPAPATSRVTFMEGRGVQTVRSDGQVQDGVSKPAYGGIRFRTIENRSSPQQRLMQVATSRRLILIEGVSATLDTADPVTGSTTVLQVSTPEIEAAKSYYIASISDPNARGVVIPSAAASAEYVYLMVGSYDQEKGTPVVKVDGDGVVTNMLLCPLPREPKRPGYLFPCQLGVNENQLFLVSAFGGVAVYNLGGAL